MDVVKPAGCDVIHGPAHVLDASTGDDVGLRSKSAPEVSEQFVELLERRVVDHRHRVEAGVTDRAVEGRIRITVQGRPDAPGKPVVTGLSDATDTGVSRTDGITKVVSPTLEGTAAPGAIVSVKVDDVDAAYAEAQRSGYEIVHPLTSEEWGPRRFFVRAPDGNVLNIVAHRE